MKLMRKTKILALIISICLMFGIFGAIGLSAAAKKLGGTLYIFDLKTFLGRLPNSVAQYDYFKLATALQGLANRENPQIYMIYENTSFNNQYGFEVDEFWLGELSKDGKYLSNSYLDYDSYPPTLDGFYSLMDDFSAFWDGFALWDHDVPATANVASTAAGADNLLPVRHYPNSKFSLYNSLFAGDSARYSLSDIKLDLVGKFTSGASGYIWDSGAISTGSAKNDAYLWAKEKYLDAGKTNPLRMANCTDSWVKPPDPNSNDVEYISVCLPDEMYPGETVSVRITVKNKTTAIWQEDGGVGVGYYRLGTIEGNVFGISNQKNGGYTDSGSSRIFVGGTVNPGETHTFEFDITAPGEPGNGRLVLQMVQDGVRWMSGIYSADIKIVDNSIGSGLAPGEIPEEKLASGGNEIVYPVMFWTTLANADYHIAQKAFFWDLSPDATIAPLDDRGQKIGEDVRTMDALLLSQAQQANFNIFNVSGFVPWNFKYTTTSDPGVSKMGDVDSEWTSINRISSYGGQVEADANAGVGDVSNCSVFMHVPLNEEFKQSNDKGKGNELTRVDGRHYISIYMGDYDSGSWTSSILSMMFANSQGDRGKYPLGWPIPTGISGRIPQLFNYIYENATANDYFIAGDNGTAYLNSTMFDPGLRPADMPDMLDTWEKYNIMMNKRFDIDVLGLHINMSTSTLSSARPSQRVLESIARMTPVGASVQSQTDFYPTTSERYGALNLSTRTILHPFMVENSSNGAVTPFIKYQDIGGAGTTAQQLASAMYDRIQNRTSGSYTTQYFHSFRCILITPAVINEALDILKAMPNADFEIVDPYTLYRLAGQQWGTQTVRFETNGGSEIADANARTRDLIYDAPADPVKEGHIFEGWHADEELTIPWDFAKDTVWEDITLYAKWEKECEHENTYEIVAIEASCEEEGLKNIYCAECGEWLGSEAIGAIGHECEWVEYGDRKENICKACGETTETVYLDFGGAKADPGSITGIEENEKNVWTVTFLVEVPYEDGTVRLIEHTVEIKKNGDGEIDLGDYILAYDIKGNGSNVKLFEIVAK